MDENQDEFDEEMDESVAEGIAIVGLSGRFPGARNAEAFWENLRAGVESITFSRAGDPGDEQVDPVLRQAPNYVRAGGLIDDTEMFDADFFGFEPREVEIMDPQHRLFLEHAWKALEDAGQALAYYDGSIGVFGGMHLPTYLMHNLLPNSRLLVEMGEIQLRLHNDKDFLTSLVAYKLDLKGPSINVQTACSSSLVAICLACQSLMTYQCDMALAGGVAIQVPMRAGYLAHEGVLSADGHTRAFGAGASGTVSGNGVGLVVLKRLEDALNEGDNVRAVIKGFATNNDGAVKQGYASPGADGQSEVIALAQAVADTPPETISYVEAHGTGTPLGDRIEVSALGRVFGAATDRRGFCALGSVKSNIGHLEAAAGVAGLIKTVLALEHGELPPSLHTAAPNPGIAFDESPFTPVTDLTAWPRGAEPRRAGVSSFALGGVNAHVILEEAPLREPAEEPRSHRLLLLSAKTEAALEEVTERLAEHLKKHPELSLDDVAFTTQLGRADFDQRRMLVCRDLSDAAEALGQHDPRRLLSGSPSAPERPVAFLFPGLGDQLPDMALELYRDEPEFRRHLDHCCEVLEAEIGFDPRQVIYPHGIDRDPAAGPAAASRPILPSRDARDAELAPEAARLARTEVAQPALFAVEYALARLWMSWGIEPRAMAGYSLGEYVAACLAGVMSLDEALRLVAARARLISELPAGAMLAVPLAEEDARAYCTRGAMGGDTMGETLSIAAVSGPELSVLAGPVDEVTAVCERLRTDGVVFRRLATTHAFHSHMMEPIIERFTERVRQVKLEAPKIPYLSNVTGTWITPRQATDPGYWAEHLRATVRFGDSLGELWKEPGRVFLEVGPGQTLGSWAWQHPASADAPDAVVLASLDPRQSDSASVALALGQLWMAGVRVDWRALHAGQGRRRVALPTYPFERRRYWIDPPSGVASPVAAASSSASASSASASSANITRRRVRAEYVGPRGTMEESLCQMYAQLTGASDVGVHDSFFDLGGDSLRASRLLTLVESDFGVGLRLKSLFEGPTVAELAVALVQEQAAQSDQEALIEALAESKQMSKDEVRAMLAAAEPVAVD